jgi:hypothetical protein
MSKTTEEKVYYFREIKVEEPRFTLLYILKDFFYNLVHLERKRYFYTAYDLTVSPGKSIQKYLDGYRQYLYQPGEYILLTGAIITFLTVRYNFFANEFTSNISSNQFLLENRDFFSAFFLYAEEYVTIVNVVAIPGFSLLSWLFFINTHHNFAENLIMNTYITAQQLLFLVLLVPFIEFMPFVKSEMIAFYNIFIVLYNVWVYFEFFQEKWHTKLLKCIAINALAFPLNIVINIGFYYLFEPLLKYLPQF